jgi:hypothetical protein
MKINKKDIDKINRSVRREQHSSLMAGRVNQIHKNKKKYSRKNKHKENDKENI